MRHHKFVGKTFRKYKVKTAQGDTRINAARTVNQLIIPLRYMFTINKLPNNLETSAFKISVLALKTTLPRLPFRLFYFYRLSFYFYDYGLAYQKCCTGSFSFSCLSSDARRRRVYQLKFVSFYEISSFYKNFISI